MNKKNIAIIGLGYVGLPLAISFVKKNFNVFGYDIDKSKIKELKNCHDRTNEIEKKSLKNLRKINFVSRINYLKKCNIFIITVPTPVDKNNIPDLRSLIDATNLVSRCIKPLDLVVYESTVYPGTTTEICGNILEKKTNLKISNNTLSKKEKNLFYLGYSPERINPGDRVHNLQNVCKLVSASSKAGVKLVKDLYKKICKNIHICSSIEIAESAKIIENTQRDLNIALINELQMIFEKMNINIYDVLDAAKTKWNFLNFQPGLVGGHCIGVDPYYLTYKAKKIGHKPKLILAGRYINDEMPNYFKKKILNLIKKKFNKKVNLLFMGLTFKENCNDLRNSKNLELCSLLSKDFLVDAYDPNMRMNNFKKIEKKINFINKIKKKYDVIIIALPHNNFIKMGFNNIKKLLKKNGIIFDLKNTFGKFFIS